MCRHHGIHGRGYNIFIHGMGPGMGMGHGPGPCMGRTFISKDERIELLGEYKKWLEKETKGVEEFIAELNKE